MAGAADKKKAKTKAAAAKSGKAKGKGKRGGQAATAAGGRPLSVAAHPRAKSHVRRSKGLGGLLGFAVAAFVSLQASVPIVTAGERALLAGLAGYLLGWACSVVVWRQLMIAELRMLAEKVAKQRAEQAE